MSGFDVADALAGGPSTVVLVSSRAPSDLGRRARESGAVGFISKDQLSEETLRAAVGGGQ
jgi:CheY-like chemotaxis protein